jgi:ABC-type molybdate transport system substrate-binding protein
VEPSRHDPLDQAIAACSRGKNAAGGAAFARFVTSPDAHAILARYGFLSPGGETPAGDRR